MNTQSSQKKSLDGVRRRLPHTLATPSHLMEEYSSTSWQEEAGQVSFQPLATYEPIKARSSFRKESGRHSRFSLDLTSMRMRLGGMTGLSVVLLAKIRGSRYVFCTSPKRALYVSLASGVAFGVFLTAITFSLFDQGVSAQSSSADEIPSETTTISRENEGMPVAGSSVEGDDVFLEYFSEAAEEEYQAKITDMVKGHPIEGMLPYIFEKDRTVAAFLVGIAKKESNWGKRIPVLDGQDCFNYWGYRGVRRLMGTGGHTCFNSRKDAVDTVAKRIEKLVYSQKLNTPEKMILWKCGFSCEGHSRESVKKWISDVSMYFNQLDDQEME
ncbi:MAG: hypothetical protein KA054_01585 [Candidatus Moranbacteria bacterium]|nr:hypothetical protein [Candidatus Moranbacteria bacterium]